MYYFTEGCLLRAEINMNIFCIELEGIEQTLSARRVGVPEEYRAYTEE